MNVNAILWICLIGYNVSWCQLLDFDQGASRALTFWVALREATAANGCNELLRASSGLTEAYGRHAALVQVCAKGTSGWTYLVSSYFQGAVPEGPSILVINCRKSSGIQPQAVLTTKVLHGKSEKSAKRVIMILVCILKWKPRGCGWQALTKGAHKITQTETVVDCSFLLRCLRRNRSAVF